MTATLVSVPPARRSGFEERWRRKPLVIPLTVLTVASMAAFPLFPLLRQAPVVLIAINPNAVLLAWSAPRLALPVFVLVATVRLCLAYPWNYALGLRYGCAARERVENTRWGPWLVRVVGVERVACAIAVFVRPSRTPLAWAGSLRMSPRFVAMLDLAGTVLYVVLLHRGMSLLGRRAGPFGQ